MELPGVRPRVSSASFDFDLENAPCKSFSHDEAKGRSTIDYLKKASRLWLAIAACIIFVFICLSSSFFSRSPSPPFPPATTSSRPSSGAPTEYKAEVESGPLLAGYRHPVFSVGRLHTKANHHHHHHHAAAGDHRPQHDATEAEQDGHQPHEEEEHEEEWDAEGEEEVAEEGENGHHRDFAEEEDEEEEAHADSQHLANTQPEYTLSHDESFDDSKQHPDEPEYIDIWDGVTHEDLHLSEGIPGLKTPLYRLPFVDGQHNNTHVIGVHAKKVLLPRFLSVSGGKRVQKITGTYRMYMTQDGRPKPHLNHGRLIWQKEGDAPVFLYYDHMHHTWVFNEQLDLHNPQPLAFLAHGAILPISKKNDNTFRKYGAPKSVHWIVREGGGSRPDGTVKVEADPAHSGNEHLQSLLLQKVHHAPEDGSLEGDVEEDDFDLFEEEHDEEQDEEGEVLLDANGEPIYLPIGARSFQQFVTHPRTSVYHTFETLHARYNHQEILKDPVAFVETNPHPDMVGPEVLDGYSHDPIPHPLRKPAHDGEDH